jgi:hypothetical protein
MEPGGNLAYRLDKEIVSLNLLSGQRRVYDPVEFGYRIGTMAGERLP